MQVCQSVVFEKKLVMMANVNNNIAQLIPIIIDLNEQVT